MTRKRSIFGPMSAALFGLFILLAAPALADDAADAKPDASKMPHLTVDVKAHQLRVECDQLRPEMPLEFFCCMSGTAEHEAVLRSAVRPQHLHLGLLMLGLKPGEPVRYSPALDKQLPPHGPPLQIFCEWSGKDGQLVHVPAYRMMRNVKTKKEMPAMTWIFAGSRVMEDGKYAADTTGYIVSVVNFDLTVIDIPELASSANESLEWEVNPTVAPDKGTKVWMVIEPAAAKDAGTKPIEKKTDAGTGTAPALAAGNAAVAPSAAGGGADAAISDVKVDEQRVKALRARWEKVVAPRNKTLREAAQAHYEVINALRREQNRLIDEADRVQRVIDQLQKDYQEMTTPQPETESPKAEAADTKPGQ